jgi:hypothetical protein
MATLSVCMIVLSRNRNGVLQTANSRSYFNCERLNEIDVELVFLLYKIFSVISIMGGASSIF